MRAWARRRPRNCGADVEALDLGGVGDLRQGAEHDASGRRGVDGGDPDGRVGAGEIVLKRGTVIAHNDANSFVIFLDEGEGFIGVYGGGAVDGE